MTHDNSVIYIVPCTLLAACYALLTTGNYSRNARNGIQAVRLYIYVYCVVQSSIIIELLEVVSSVSMVSGFKIILHLCDMWWST